MIQTLPKILPVNELKNTGNISKICKESETPIVITKNGYSDMVIMSVELFEQIMSKVKLTNSNNNTIDENE